MKKMINFRNIFLLLVASCLMLTSTPVTAQSDACMIDMPDSFAEPSDNNLWCFPQGYYFNVDIAFHIVRDINGNGGTTLDELNKAIAILQHDFSPSITFRVVKVDDVKSTQSKNYFTGNAYKLSTSGGPTPNLFFDLADENRVPNALNVYLGPSSNVNDGGIAWLSQLVCTVGGSRVGEVGSPATYLVPSRAISHEVAHLLGLLHTFQRQPSEVASVRPLINGQVCGATGDLVCDTPVDPSQPRTDLANHFDFRPLLSNCSWNNTSEEDPAAQLYTPNTSNIMAYTHVTCMQTFTLGQFRRMHSYCMIPSGVIENSGAVTYAWLNWLTCTGKGSGVSSTSLKMQYKPQDLEFKVFPNPASEFIAVQFLSDSRETDIQITDIAGRSVYKQKIGKTNKNDIHEIDVNVLTKGILFLTISNEIDKKVSKVVIQ